MDKLDQYVSVVPNPQQKAIQEMGFNAFIHYGMTTFIGKEWGDGKTPPSTFNPSDQDTDQWVAALKDAGAQGIILTAKHHDGFCLWQTDTTEYSIKNSPYKGGKGDVVREVSDSCRKYGVKFGVYLSPWDRNSKYYGTPKYNDFYIAQLTELLTRYGEIFCIWLDGACGSYMDGKPKQVYDFPRIYKTVRELQPMCCISNCGPDVRWVGNEGGYARESEWNVVPKFAFDVQQIADNSQQADGQDLQQKGMDIVSEDLGSREVLSNYHDFIWYPAEVDVSIRPGWFYHKSQDRSVRSLNNLLNIYYTSVGGNSLLLLNVPPDTRGRFCDKDIRRLHELGEAIRKGVEKPVKVARLDAYRPEPGFEIKNILTNDESCYTPERETPFYKVELHFDHPVTIDKVQLKEQCDYSQRIEKYEIYALLDGKEKKVYEGTTVGYNRFALFKPVQADGVRLVITSCRRRPYLRLMMPYEANGFLPKTPWYKPIILAAHKLNYLIYITRENRHKAKVEAKQNKMTVKKAVEQAVEHEADQM